jgi:hypothetical protein
MDLLDECVNAGQRRPAMGWLFIVSCGWPSWSVENEREPLS